MFLQRHGTTPRSRMESLIVTLTVNPAIDLNVSADRLVFDDRAYIDSTTEAAGGRGINASCVLQAFGTPTLAIATSGGEAGRRFEEFLSGCGFRIEVVRIRNEIRRNFTITDRQGLTVKLNERGPVMDVEEVERLEKRVHGRLAEASWLMLCGSLPPGVPRDFYRRLIGKARETGVKTMLDTDGEALREGIEAGPTVVAPNQQEAERLLNKVLITQGHFEEAVRAVHSMGPQSVILSLGSRGAICADGDTTWEVLAPRVDAVCPIGAGDALNAAFVWAVEQNKDFADAVRWGVAAGTASARLPGLRFAGLEATREIYEQVEIRGLS
jgi:1-phosphofructokinase family hexose kinase